MSEVDVSHTARVARVAAQHLPTLGLRGLDALAGASAADQPLRIYDVNGELLFHDHYLMSNGEVVGAVRTAANRKLGALVVAAYHAKPGWNATAALRLARESLTALHPEAQISQSRLVCYAYPKIGVEVKFALNNEVKVEIFDASSGGHVAESGGEGQFSRYSLLDRLEPAQHARNIEAYENAYEQLKGLPDSLPSDAGGLSATAMKIFLPPWTLFGPVTALVLQSPWCPGSPMGNSHYAQITDYFCVDASTQMLLEHYGFNYTQNQIATAMGTKASQGGTTQSGITTGFKSLTNNDLILTFDNGASRAQQFQDAVNEVSANRPLFTQVPHHYRVCMGYGLNNNPIAIILGLAQSLYIFDPWPWNANLCDPGSPYWESWATSPVMWFGIVHHA
jgi:hypothetical protein